MDEIAQQGVFRRLQPRVLIAATLLAGAVGTAVLDDGGFRPGPRWIFVGLALAALAAASLCDSTGAAIAARQPVVVTLWLLGILGIASAAWTVGGAGPAIRWGLVTIGYGAIALSAFILSARRNAIAWVAALICVLAFVDAVIGLCGATAFAQPFADYMDGFWRPGGTLEYSAALALLQISALPALLTGMVHGRRLIALPATLGAATAAAVLGLSHSRLEGVFALLIGAAVLGWHERTVKTDRRTAVLAVALLGATALGAYVIAGRSVAIGAHPHQLARLGGLAALCCATTLGWWISRAPSTSRVQKAAALTSLTGVTVAVVSLTANWGDTSHIFPAQAAGFFHGRLQLWKIAVRAAAHQLLHGYGADSFLVASRTQAPLQGIRFAHNLPVELLLELGVPGLLLAISLYWTGLRSAWQARRDRAFWIVGPAAIGFLIADLFDWEWHLAGSGAVWALALGALLRAGFSRRESPQ